MMTMNSCCAMLCMSTMISTTVTAMTTTLRTTSCQRRPSARQRRMRAAPTSRALGDDLVADAASGHDGGGRVRVAQLLAQPEDVHVDRPLQCGKAVVRIQPVDQLTASQHPSGSFQHEGKQP